MRRREDSVVRGRGRNFRRHYCDATESLLLAMLSKRSWIAISSQARKLGLRREKHGDGGAGVPKRSWQEWEKDLIRACYDARITRGELRKRLPHRRWDYIKAKANDTGPEWVKRQPGATPDLGGFPRNRFRCPEHHRCFSQWRTAQADQNRRLHP